MQRAAEPLKKGAEDKYTASCVVSYSQPNHCSWVSTQQAATIPSLKALPSPTLPSTASCHHRRGLALQAGAFPFLTK